MILKNLAVTLVVMLSLSSHNVFAAVTRDHVEKAPELKFASTRLEAEYRVEGRELFIGHILAAHEAAFPGAIRYADIEYFTSFDRLNFFMLGLVQNLERNKKYGALLSAREPMTEAVFTVNKNLETKTEIEINQDEVIVLLRRFIEDLRRVLDDRANIDEAIDELRRSLLLYRAHPIYTKEQMKEMGRTVFSYVLLSTWASQLTIRPADGRPTWDWLQNHINKFSVASLDRMKDEHSFGPHLAAIYTHPEINPNYLDLALDADDWSAILRSYTAKLENKIYSRKEKVAGFQKGYQLTLKEVHPLLAIYRGYVGNDCATEFSPGFAFSPLDRYYYIFDNEGQSLGYVGLTFVKAEETNEKMLFVHTIQGPEVTGSQTEMILQGLKKLAPKLGAKGVMLANDYNIGENMNFKPIVRAMRGAVANQKEEGIVFSDHDYRHEIARYGSQMTFDDPQRNRYARRVEFDELYVSLKHNTSPFIATLNLTEYKTNSCAEYLNGQSEIADRR